MMKQTLVKHKKASLIVCIYSEIKSSCRWFIAHTNQQQPDYNLLERYYRQQISIKILNDYSDDQKEEEGEEKQRNKDSSLSLGDYSAKCSYITTVSYLVSLFIGQSRNERLQTRKTEVQNRQKRHSQDMLGCN